MSNSRSSAGLVLINACPMLGRSPELLQRHTVAHGAPKEGYPPCDAEAHNDVARDNMPADDAEEAHIEEKNRDLEEGYCSSVEGAAGDDGLE